MASAEPEADVLAALDRVVRAQRVGLVRLAQSEGLDAEDALDSVHDALCTFLELAVRRALPTQIDAYGPLLSGIVRNAARNKRRRHHLARPHEPMAVLESVPVDDGSALETLLRHTEDCVRLKSCVDQLCKRQRTVVLMRLLEERPGEDVAAELGLRRGHVDVLLHRAKASLLVCMSAGDAESP